MRAPGASGADVFADAPRRLVTFDPGNWPLTGEKGYHEGIPDERAKVYAKHHLWSRARNDWIIDRLPTVSRSEATSIGQRDERARGETLGDAWARFAGMVPPDSGNRATRQARDRALRRFEAEAEGDR